MARVIVWYRMVSYDIVRCVFDMVCSAISSKDQPDGQPDGQPVTRRDGLGLVTLTWRRGWTHPRLGSRRRRLDARH